MFTQELVYMGCAAAGGCVLVIQSLLLVFGLGDGHDADHDIHPEDSGPGHADTHEGSGSFQLFSVRSIVAFLTFFGLGGWWGCGRDWNAWIVALFAAGCGASIGLVVAWVLSMQRRLNTQGNLRPEQAVGSVARVYLRIPARRASPGKITVALQGRTAEFLALTDGEELASGQQVRVLALVGPDTFVVGPL